MAELGKIAPGDRPRGARTGAADHPGARRDHRPERPRPGPRVQPGGADRRRAPRQARRHGQGRHGGRHRQRAAAAGRSSSASARRPTTWSNSAPGSSPLLSSAEALPRGALRLAARGRYRTSPNPMVGALVVACVGERWWAAAGTVRRRAARRGRGAARRRRARARGHALRHARALRALTAAHRPAPTRCSPRASPASSPVTAIPIRGSPAGASAAAARPASRWSRDPRRRGGRLNLRFLVAATLLAGRRSRSSGR